MNNNEEEYKPLLQNKYLIIFEKPLNYSNKDKS